MAGVVVGAIFLVRALNRERSAPLTQTGTMQPRATTSDEAREILRRRYANGDIEREEYLRKLKDLGPP